jgi:hypothetical protein
VELHFGPNDKLFPGLKLAGFVLWESKRDGGGHNVTFPARNFVKSNGEKGTFTLLRPIEDGDRRAGDDLIDLIVKSYLEARSNGGRNANRGVGDRGSSGTTDRRGDRGYR